MTTSVTPPQSGVFLESLTLTYIHELNSLISSSKTSTCVLDPIPTKLAHHSTDTALVKVLNDLFIASDHGCISILVLLDLSAALDTIDHHILLQRLEHHVGMKGCALSWLRYYLSDHLQFARPQ